MCIPFITVAMTFLREFLARDAERRGWIVHAFSLFTKKLLPWRLGLYRGGGVSSFLRFCFGLSLGMKASKVFFLLFF